MSRSANIDLDWADGRHRFRLAIGELEELQEKTGIGPLALINRLHDGSWRTADVRETLRIGLIGGGMEPPEALALVRRYVDERPAWLQNAMLALAVITAGVSGVEDEPVKKKAGGTGRRAVKAKPDGLWTFADFYGVGVAIGCPPSEVRAMSLWQFAACVNGWNDAQKSEDERARELDDDEADALWAVLEAPPMWERH